MRLRICGSRVAFARCHTCRDAWGRSIIWQCEPQIAATVWLAIIVRLSVLLNFFLMLTQAFVSLSQGLDADYNFCRPTSSNYRIDSGLDVSAFASSRMLFSATTMMPRPKFVMTTGVYLRIPWTCGELCQYRYRRCFINEVYGYDEVSELCNVIVRIIPPRLYRVF